VVRVLPGLRPVRKLERVRERQKVKEPVRAHPRARKMRLAA
jgi:hypothetical protein